MSRFTIAGLALAAALAFGIVATSASALSLPEVFAPSGGSFPILISGHLTSKSILENIAGERLEATGTEVTIRLEKAGPALGTYDALILNVTEKTTGDECNTPPLPSGDLLVLGLVHVVYIPPFPRVGLLILLPTTTYDCGTTANPTKIKIKIGGSELASYNGTINTATTTFNGALRANGKGRAALKTYYNDEGKEVFSQLLSNFGLGLEESVINDEGTIPFIVNGGQSFILSAA